MDDFVCLVEIFELYNWHAFMNITSILIQRHWVRWKADCVPKEIEIATPNTLRFGILVREMKKS